LAAGETATAEAAAAETATTAEAEAAAALSPKVASASAQTCIALPMLLWRFAGKPTAAQCAQQIHTFLLQLAHEVQIGSAKGRNAASGGKEFAKALAYVQGLLLVFSHCCEVENEVVVYGGRAGKGTQRTGKALSDLVVGKLAIPSKAAKKEGIAHLMLNYKLVQRVSWAHSEHVHMLH
jgi:hypothetical protein